MNNRFAWLLVILTIFLLVPIWAVEYPPLLDYPKHLLTIKVLKEFHSPAYPYSTFFELQRIPIPNLMFQILGLSLSFLLNLYITGRILVSLCILSFVFSIYFFFSSFEREKRIFSLFVFPFVYNWYFSLGLLNYLIGLSLFFVILGWWLRTKDNMKVSTQVGLSFLLLLTYFSHLFPFLSAILCISGLCLLEYAGVKKILRQWFLVPGFLLYIYYFVYGLLFSEAKYRTEFSTISENITQFLISFISYSKYEILLFAIPFLFFCIFLVDNLRKTDSLRNFPFLRNTIEGRFLILFLILIILYFVMPHVGFGGWALNTRLNLIIPFIGLASVRFSRKPIVIKAFIICLCATSVGVVCYHWAWYLRFNREFRDFKSGIQYVREGSRILPLIIIEKQRHIDPVESFWAYYHLAKGGIGPYFFAMPLVHPIKYKSEMMQNLRNPGMFPFEGNKFDIRKHGDPYDYILTWGDEGGLKREIEKRFKLIHAQGKLQLYEKRL